MQEGQRQRLRPTMEKTQSVSSSDLPSAGWRILRTHAVSSLAGPSRASNPSHPLKPSAHSSPFDHNTQLNHRSCSVPETSGGSSQPSSSKRPRRNRSMPQAGVDGAPSMYNTVGLSSRPLDRPSASSSTSPRYTGAGAGALHTPQKINHDSSGNSATASASARRAAGGAGSHRVDIDGLVTQLERRYARKQKQKQQQEQQQQQGKRRMELGAGSGARDRDGLDAYAQENVSPASHRSTSMSMSTSTTMPSSSTSSSWTARRMEIDPSRSAEVDVPRDGLRSYDDRHMSMRIDDDHQSRPPKNHHHQKYSVCSSSRPIAGYGTSSIDCNPLQQQQQQQQNHQQSSHHHHHHHHAFTPKWHSPLAPTKTDRKEENAPRVRAGQQQREGLRADNGIRSASFMPGPAAAAAAAVSSRPVSPASAASMSAQSGRQASSNSSSCAGPPAPPTRTTTPATTTAKKPFKISEAVRRQWERENRLAEAEQQKEKAASIIAAEGGGITWSGSQQSAQPSGGTAQQAIHKQAASLSTVAAERPPPLLAPFTNQEQLPADHHPTMTSAGKIAATAGALAGPPSEIPPPPNAAAMGDTSVDSIDIDVDVDMEALLCSGGEEVERLLNLCDGTQVG